MKKNIGTTLLCIILLFLITAPQISAVDWSMFGKDITRSSASSITYSDRLTKLWSTSFGLGIQSPILSNNQIFALSTSTDEEKTICVDAVTGETVWSYSQGIATSNQFTSPCGNDQFVYIPTNDNQLICLDAQGTGGTTE